MITQNLTVMDDGIALRAVLEAADGGPRPLVICLHGFTSSKDRPHTLAACAAMREAGFATLRADLYGHGESGGEFRKHTLHKWISNTLALIDRARALGYAEIWLSGHSQGGLTAALVGGMAPDLVRGLILRAPAFMIPAAARAGSMLGYAFDPARIPDEVPVIKGLTLEGAYVRVAQTVHVEEAMARFPGPVLILHGDRDDTVPLADSADAVRRYPNARLEVLRGETHHFDRCAGRMCEIIRAWLTEQRGA